jgi:hypothetical protein
MPTDHGLGYDQDERLVPGPPDPRQEHPESSITRLQPRLLDGSSQDPDLVPEREVLDLEGGAGSEDPVDHGEQRGKPSHAGDILVWSEL